MTLLQLMKLYPCISFMIVLSGNYGAIKAKNDNNSRSFVMSAFLLGADIYRRVVFNSSMSLDGRLC